MPDQKKSGGASETLKDTIAGGAKPLIEVGKAENQAAAWADRMPEALKAAVSAKRT